MSTTITELKIARCGPGDVFKEIEIVGDVITEWNKQHWDALNCALKHQHWSTDAVPDMKDRAQGVINRQIIDSSDIIVAIFWSRFGTPTGLAQSGTEEEIRRAMDKGKRVMLYFSDLEMPSQTADLKQLDKLQSFRIEMKETGLAWSFKNRKEFKDLFRVHLAKAVHELRTKIAVKKTRIPKGKSVHQNATGGHNVLVAGDGNTTTVYKNPPKQKIILERSPDQISSAEQVSVKEWIDELVALTVGKTQADAYKHWWSVLKSTFKVPRYEALTIHELPLVKVWFVQQRGILTRKQKTKAPESWRRLREIAIKAAMRSMKKEKEDYYQEISQRLKMKKIFSSLKELTRTDLDRVYNMVLSDQRGA